MLPTAGSKLTTPGSVPLLYCFWTGCGPTTKLRLLPMLACLSVMTLAPSAATADAWSAAQRLEKDILIVQPWDPDSFRHPLQYDEYGRKRKSGPHIEDGNKTDAPALGETPPAH
jgi:hypothetical protein